MFDQATQEGYRQVGHRFETVIRKAPNGIACITPYDTLPEARAAFYQAMHERTGEWQLRGIRQTGPNEFKAYVKGPKGKAYLVGTFKDEKEAEHAIFDAMHAHWNG